MIVSLSFRLDSTFMGIENKKRTLTPSQTFWWTINKQSRKTHPNPSLNIASDVLCMCIERIWDELERDEKDVATTS